ncbi:MAG: peptide deformylase [bacterium]|nr:peptide deformylase [bacterium]
MKIVTVDNQKKAKILRKKTADFNFGSLSKAELRKLIKEMRQTMKDADGVGLSANQVNIGSNFFVAQVENKFYSIFNPKTEKASKEKIPLEEGCLSIPGVYGPVERPDKITLTGLDINGKKVKIKAWGLLARVFQHEVDHLNGKLFLDKCKDPYTIEGFEPKNLKSE